MKIRDEVQLIDEPPRTARLGEVLELPSDDRRCRCDRPRKVCELSAQRGEYPRRRVRHRWHLEGRLAEQWYRQIDQQGGHRTSQMRS